MNRGSFAQNDFIKFLSMIGDQGCNPSGKVLRALFDVEVKTESSGLLFFDFPIHPRKQAERATHPFADF